jgi:3'-phosphoadenosine 5'-phosphosulfate sulfotransferase (PAPS reductase)/FAD synthetase
LIKKEIKANLRVLSLGAGVQSSTLALMIEKGEVPMVDCAVFSDTKGEPQAVYDWLDWLEKQLSFPVYKVTWRDLKQDILDAAEGKYNAFTIPFFTKNKETGKKKMLLRQCTNDYKIRPIVQKVRELIGLKKGEKRKKGTKVEMLMGISLDEVFRVKPNRVKYITNEYPLIEKKMRREDCVKWMAKYNYPEPPRSACTFCPYHNDKEWLYVKQNKNEWDEVVKIDKAIRNQERLKNNKDANYSQDEYFLHRSAVPIDEVDFDKSENQMDFFSEECSGYCGN